VALVFATAAYVMREISAGYPESALVRNPLALLPDLAIWRLINSTTVSFPVMVVVIAGSVSLVVRVRRAVGTERQQLRWIAASFAVLMAAVVSGVALSLLVPGAGDGPAWFPAIFALPTVPIAIGIAVLRYRLYEIDRIISRTIAWAVVTGVLGAVFVGVVIALQAALSEVTQGQTLAVAASTLVACALFQPVRGRVQSAVDRRFDRARYDGRRTVDAFAEHLRDEVDLARLSGAVLVTADEAVRPAAAGLWLRGAPR
jgi:hypothetical protein